MGQVLGLESPGYEAAGPALSVGGRGCWADKAIEDRRSHQGGDNGHNHQHGKQLVGNQATFATDIDDDQFHQAASVHEDANAKRFPIGNSRRPRSQPAGNTFADHRDHHHQQTHQPAGRCIQQADSCVEPAEGKEQSVLQKRHV